MEPDDFLPGQKACERRSPVPLHGPRGVRFEVTAVDREVHDLAEKIERVIGVAGGSPAEAVEPLCDLHEGNAVERLRAEGRQQLAVEHGPDALPGGRLVAAEMGFLPCCASHLSHPGCIKNADRSAGSGDGAIFAVRRA